MEEEENQNTLASPYNSSSEWETLTWIFFQTQRRSLQGGVLCVDFCSITEANFSFCAGDVRLEVANRGRGKIQCQLPSVPKSLDVEETLPSDLWGGVGRSQLLTSLPCFHSFLNPLLSFYTHPHPPICPYGRSNIKLVIMDGHYKCPEFLGKNVFAPIRIHMMYFFSISDGFYQETKMF